jgi:hypothetical protein
LLSVGEADSAVFGNVPTCASAFTANNRRTTAINGRLLTTGAPLLLTGAC